MGKSISFVKKLFIDPCPILEYFVSPDDNDIIKALVGPEGIQELLDVHTVNPEYALSIARRMSVEYTPTYPVISLEETKAILSRPLSETASAHLTQRKFPMELVPQYEVSCWKWEPHQFSTWARYFPFNREAMLVASVILAKLNFVVDLSQEEFIICPSYDRQGNLNNLVFRFISDNIVFYMSKWLFSHGRQATFGLHKVDPSQPVFIVEGFYDHVACDLMGIQSVGLGSAFISYDHYRFLEGLDLIFLLDSDETGRRYSQRLAAEGNRVLFLSDEFKDPWEYYQNGKELKFI